MGLEIYNGGFTVSAFDTDNILVKKENIESAMDALTIATRCC